jgi:fluoride exporter
MRLAMEFAISFARKLPEPFSGLITPTGIICIGRTLMLTYLWLGLGGAIGTIARYWLDGVVSDRFGKTFPFGILTINITGSFVIGLLFALFGPESRSLIRPTVYGFFTIGICGGFTTFSSFSLGTLTLAREGQWLQAGAYVVSSVVFCLLAVWLGYVLGASLNSKTGG